MDKGFDNTDWEILHHLQENARITNSQLAQLVQLSPAGLQKRIQKLEENGVIEHYVTLVNTEKVGFDLLCFVQISLQRHEVDSVKDFQEAVRGMPEVLECYHIIGETDYLLKVIVRNRKHLEHFLLETLTPAPRVDKIRTSLVLSNIKVTTALPLSTNIVDSKNK